ncbi:MAG TPA: D-glycerate dehydrogenase [Phycisphaerae bacterium]|nr:D-glycerate dehydrogenase [Phycisphaerae bacterium]
MARSVYITRVIPDSGPALLGEGGLSVKVNPHDRGLSRSELLAAVAGRDALLTMLNDAIDEQVLDAAGPSCRIVANYAVGFNNIDLAAATRRGILVTNTPGVLTEATADLTWALILAVARRIPEADAFLRTGRWDGWGPMQFLGHDVHGATLAIVGAGRIGNAVGLRSTGFRMRLLYVDRQNNSELDRIGGKRVDLDTALREADFLSLHVPLTPETQRLIGRPQIERMKPSACIINTARGPIIDEQALVEALRSRRIAGAGLDVYESEPRLTPGLIELNNVVCIPHLGSGTEATRSRMAEMAAVNILAALQDREPPNLLNREAWNAKK